jgi:hypothetical protein
MGFTVADESGGGGGANGGAGGACVTNAGYGKVCCCHSHSFCIHATYKRTTIGA